MVLKECSFKNRYTIYSLRSTHISNQLLKGVQVNKVAKNVGTSMEMIQQTYDGLSSRYSIDELGFFKDTNVPKEEEEDLSLDYSIGSQHPLQSCSHAIEPPNACN